MGLPIAKEGAKIMKAITILERIERPPTGAPSEEEKEHDKNAKQHFLRYCDTGKCVNPPAHKRNWHTWPCTECTCNPYNMRKEEAQ